MTAGLATALTGALRLRPGVAVPHGIWSSRPDLVARLASGQRAHDWPSRVGSLFNLCGHAQRLCATLAVRAAAPGVLPPPTGVAERLRTETAQEHVRRIGLDWPRLLGGGDSDRLATQAASDVGACPILKADAGDGAWAPMSDWLQAVLGLPPERWLEAWHADGADWLSAWTRQQMGWLPGLLGQARAWDVPGTVDPATALRVPDNVAELDAGVAAHTGSWSRVGRRPFSAPMTPWALLGSRIAELITLSVGHNQATLAWGAHATGAGQGLAWVEMARGLLLHWVAVDEATGRLLACRLLPPTDANFHPEGQVARHLAALDAQAPEADLARHVRLLVAAFDPCVPFEIAQAQLPGHKNPAEAAHA